MTSRIWLRLSAVAAAFACVLLAAMVSEAQDAARTENVTIHVLATADGTGEFLECG